MHESLSVAERLCKLVEGVAAVETLTPLCPSCQNGVEVFQFTGELGLHRIAPEFGQVSSIFGDYTTRYKMACQVSARALRSIGIFHLHTCIFLRMSPWISRNIFEP
jgi:hypothetical protein